MGYEYPTDGDTSIGTYDLVIPKVSWKEHNNMQYRCQIRELRKGSDFAKLTVIGLASPKPKLYIIYKLSQATDVDI